MHEQMKQIISQAMNTRFQFERQLIERALEDENFKQELLSNPKAVYARESGEKLPKDLEIEVIQETPNKVYLVLPTNPAIAEEELSEEALEAVAGGTCVAWTFYKKCKEYSKTYSANDLV
ncbi:NHLP leader peptide family RiPP precursor [Microseira wollei]|uniref:Nitrile hydratase-like protein n=1 Tax=Microseira wollei NIES-4236 TaxID=2530354 RepID=A0AAV3XBK3_9CYAN|nr:NHLP leader peptide family RiPP precursor [Microseira wollei]GET37480.1 nitrile hydratase-like protein [Microseira wollei NIES-4236]